MRTVDEIADDISLGIIRLDEAVAELADANRVDDLAELVERRISLPRGDAVACFCARTELPVALMCRALGMTLNGYSAILRMRRRAHLSTEAVPAALLSAYSGVPRPTLEELQGRLMTASESGDQPG